MTGRVDLDDSTSQGYEEYMRVRYGEKATDFDLIKQSKCSFSVNHLYLNKKNIYIQSAVIVLEDKSLILSRFQTCLKKVRGQI